MREEIKQYKGEPLEKVYEGEKIDDLIAIDKQIKELKEKRREIINSIRQEVLIIPKSGFPLPGFLYFDTQETELVDSTYGWKRHKRPTGKMISDARLAFITTYYTGEYFDDKKIVFYPSFHSISSDNKPGNSICKGGMYNIEFEPLNEMTIDEAKKVLKKVKKDLKKETK